MPRSRFCPARRRAGCRRNAAALAVAVVVAGGGCTGGGGDVEDRTAQVKVGDRTSTYQVDSCGLDDQTVFVVGRADGGRILQGVLALEDDGTTGVRR